MMDLCCTLARLQADYAKIKHDDDSLQRQRLQWMSFMEQWMAQQVELLECVRGSGASYSAAREDAHQKASCLYRSVSSSSAYEDEDQNHPEWIEQEIHGNHECNEHAATASIAQRQAAGIVDDRCDQHAPSRGAPVFIEEALHASPDELMKHAISDASAPAMMTVQVPRGNSVAKLGRTRQTLAKWGLDSATLEKDLDELDDGLVMSQRVPLRIVRTALFDGSMCVLILLSTIFNGWEVELLAANSKSADSIPFLEIQMFFSAVFFVELIMRILAFRCSFFFNIDWHWNVFDLILVAISFVEVGLLISKSGESDSVLTHPSQRLLRTARLIRNLRIVRMVRFFYELRQMLRAVFGSAKTLVWLGILLGMLLYFFALCFVSGVTDHLEGKGDGFSNEDTELLRQEYGSLLSAILSLFKAVTNGVSWGQTMEPLKEISYFLVLLYIVYIIFTVFAFMNAVTSVFVDNAMQAAQHEKEHLIQEKIKQKERMLSKLETLFLETDTDCSGFVSKEEFTKKLEDEQTLAYFHVLGIEAHDAKILFDLIDEDESNSIEIHEFLRVCPRLMGPSASFEVAHVKHEILKVSRRMKRFFEYSMGQFEKITYAGKPNSAPGNGLGGACGLVEISTAEAVEGRPLRMHEAVECLPPAGSFSSNLAKERAGGLPFTPAPFISAQPPEGTFRELASTV